ncbi:hypothetical protein [Paenibacillus eucommiae]|uniref:Uncharacterized protein n=1 Tax=Paenibacillus eucommiae TaxID=1355755 RepID=A0ABS4J8G8_9BACL|nr:hypothetical protein [Paenibacillus eucommiae]MBP1996138.1 hypothetical protein [Paenibacillus eucommiae]
MDSTVKKESINTLSNRNLKGKEHLCASKDECDKTAFYPISPVHLALYYSYFSEVDVLAEIV